VVLMPPLAIGDDDLETLVGTVEQCIREVLA
jgi:adenosylmethionine-8-amino-7-oxononanoate aminotransferase